MARRASSYMPMVEEIDETIELLEIYLSAFARRLALSASRRTYRLPMAN
jgi:hypothetical protein